MPLLNRRSFLQDVCSQIKWRGAHQEICKELDSHMEERIERLERLGRTPEEAEKEAVAAMGDPIQIGKELNRYHKPYLSWILNVSWGVIALLAIYLIVSVIWPWASSLAAQNKSNRTDKNVVWSVQTDQTQQIDNRIVRLKGADYTEEGDLYVYWETELQEPYRNGWSFSPYYDAYDQDGKRVDQQVKTVGTGGENILIYSNFNAENIKVITFIYDKYHRTMEFVLDLTQRRENQ